MPVREAREYGLNARDRALEIERKFGAAEAPRANAALALVADPSESVLGAIVFLATRVDELPELVALANENRERLLNAATVKEERG